MARTRSIAAAAAALALTFPAAAFADSAGDNQYSDPFGNTAPSATTPAPPPPSTTNTAPATVTSSPTTASSASPATSSSKADPNAQLPRTGLDLRLVGGLGVLLIGAGFLLRRRLARSS
jgi:hypothetical protein